MTAAYKPNQYNSLSPYLIVDDAQALVGLLSEIFHATQLRRFDREDGRIAHVELKVDDTVIMISDSTESFPANKTMLHVYVPDVFETYKRAVERGCTIMEQPVRKENDPDTRGAFIDLAGNYWAVSTQAVST